MSEISTWRLYLLRGLYLLIAVGLAFSVWPGLIPPPTDLEHMYSVVQSVLAAISLLSLVGVFMPLRMLPLLFFEFLWKAIWVLLFGLPMWMSGTLDAGTAETLFACMMGIVLVPIAVPWDYVFRSYFRRKTASSV